jgi:hypothetical protein
MPGLSSEARWVMTRHEPLLPQDATLRQELLARRSQGEMRKAEREVFDARTPQDVTSVRAKSSGHGKKTADKWNQ